jgi:hypothetical protein
MAAFAVSLTANLAAYDRDLERVFDFMEREQIAGKELAISQILIFCGGEAFYGRFGEASFLSLAEYDDWKDVFHLEFSITGATQDSKSLTRSLAYLSVQKLFELPVSVLCGISGLSKSNMGFDGPGTYTGITWSPDGGYTLTNLDPFFKLGVDLGALSLDGYYAGALSAFSPLYSYLMPGLHFFRDAFNVAIIAESYKDSRGDGSVKAYLGANARFGRPGKPSAADREKGWSRLSLDARLYNIVPIDFDDLRGFIATTALEPANYDGIGDGIGYSYRSIGLLMRPGSRAGS